MSCRAAEASDLCSVCGQYRSESAQADARAAAGATSEGVRPRNRAGRWLIAALLAANLAVGGFVLITSQQGHDELVSDAVKTLQTVVDAVEASRDARGRFPANLGGALGRLPKPVGTLVRGGDLSYRTNDDRTTFEVTLRLRAREGPDRSDPQEQALDRKR